MGIMLNYNIAAHFVLESFTSYYPQRKQHLSLSDIFFEGLSGIFLPVDKHSLVVDYQKAAKLFGEGVVETH